MLLLSSMDAFTKNAHKQLAMQRTARRQATMKRAAAAAGGLALAVGLAGLLGGMLAKRNKKKKQRGGTIDYLWNPSPRKRIPILGGLEF